MTSLPARATLVAMEEDDALHKLLDENRRLKQRVVEIEERSLSDEGGANQGSDLRHAKVEVAQLLKLVAQKDKILGSYATEIERKAEKLRATVDELRRKNDELQGGMGRLTLLQEAVERLQDPIVAVDAEGRVAFANRAARDLAGDAARIGTGAEAAAVLRAVNAGLADDLRAALAGQAPAPRRLSAAGRPARAQVYAVAVGGALHGAVVHVAFNLPPSGASKGVESPECPAT